MAPDVALEDERGGTWTPEQTASQEWLWSVFMTGIERARQIAGGSEIMAFHLGDVSHGNKFADKELVSSRMADQFEIGHRTLAAILDVPEVAGMYLIHGTGVHEFGLGSATSIVAKRLEASYPAKLIGSVTHGAVRYGGLDLDLAHHGPPAGSRNWLQGNVLRLYVQSLMDDRITGGRRPPDILARGHYHQYAPEVVTRRAWGVTHRTWAYILPALCVLDDYARKVARSPQSLTSGMLMLEVAGGRIIAEHELMQSIDLRTEVDLDERGHATKDDRRHRERTRKARSARSRHDVS
jgi:hypothetical protein